MAVKDLRPAPMSSASATVAAAWTWGPKMPPMMEHKKMRPRYRKKERGFCGIRETILRLSIPDDLTREAGGWWQGDAGTRGRADAGTRRSRFWGGRELCIVVRGWADLCWGGWLGVFGRTMPIWCKVIVFIVLGSIRRFSIWLVGFPERGRFGELLPASIAP